MAIRVSAPGLATSVQDLGRPGYYHLGIPISGGMDRYALRAANLLVGNDEGAAVLETVFMGPQLEFTEDATVAVTGAELPPRVDGEPRETWTAFAVEAGRTLSFDYLKSGARACIAVAVAASTFRSSSAAVRPTRSASSADSKAGTCRRGTSCRSVLRARAPRPKAAASPRHLRRMYPARRSSSG